MRVSAYGAALLVEYVIVVRHFPNFGMMIKSEHLFFKKRNIFIGNGGINYPFVRVYSKRNLQSKIIFFGIIFAFGYGLHAGVKLLHGADEFFEAFGFVGFVI